MYLFSVIQRRLNEIFANHIQQINNWYNESIESIKQDLNQLHTVYQEYKKSQSSVDMAEKTAMATIVMDNKN